MKKLLVVLGAGASIDFGMPSVANIDTLFENLGFQHFPILESKTDWNDNLYSWTKRNLAPNDIEKLNYEDIMFRIQNIASFAGNYPTIFGDNTEFTWPINLPKIRSYHNYETWTNADELIKMNSVLNYGLLTEIRKRCKSLKKEKSNELSSLRQFFQALKQNFDLGFVNLNHDNVIMTALPDLSTGFRKSDGELDSSFFYQKQWNFCYHIHGSIHFNMIDDEKIIWNGDLDSEFGLGPQQRRDFRTDEGAIHPMSTIITGKDKINQIYRNPFSSYFLNLDYRIYESDAILFIGYGFNDSYFNKLVLSHCKNNIKKRNLVVIDFKSPEDNSFANGNCSEWGYRVLNTTHTAFYEMCNGQSNLDLVPKKVAHYIETKTFEQSQNDLNPLSIWYSGLLDACENADLFSEVLNS